MPAAPTENSIARRVKLAVLSTFVGACILCLAFYLVLGAIKMSRGDPLGYQQRDHRTGEIRTGDR